MSKFYICIKKFYGQILHFISSLYVALNAR